MKKLLMTVAALVLTVACSSQKEPAEAAVNGLQTAADAAESNIEKFAPDRLAGVKDAVAAVKAKFDAENYAGALADVPAASAMVTTAAEAARDDRRSWARSFQKQRSRDWERQEGES